MNVATASLVSTLTSRTRDLVCLVEFYPSTYFPTVHGFEPPSAIARFATETCSFQLDGTVGPASYYREALSMPSLSRNLGKQSNSCTVRFSNVSRRLATFVLTNDVEGMRMIVRIVSRANLLADFGAGNNGWVLFVGRCGLPEGFDRKDASITAKQDLGQIEAQIPPATFEKDCILEFKGRDCLRNILLADHSAEYQAGLTCNKTVGQCLEYDNLEARQGIQIVQIEGSFIHRPHEGFFAKLIGLLTPGSGKRRIRVGSSIEDGTPYGKARPIVLGRWQMSGIPLQFQDIGTSINFLMAFAHGPIGGYANIRNNTIGFTQPIGVTEHYGNYGGEANQLADTVFPQHGFFSRLAYITGYVNGSDIAVEEPAPDISAIVKGISTGQLVNGSYLNRLGTGTVYGETVQYSTVFGSWTDNPVEQVRFVLTDGSLLNLGDTWIDQRRTGVTSVYCNGGVQDLSNAERLVLPNSETLKAGVDYFRYHSTGLLVPESYRVGVQQFPVPQHAKEVEYEFYDESAPPTSFELKTWYRKRFTSNIALTEQRKALDFVYDVLLPTFRGYLSWNSRGQIAIRCERPADSVLLREASIAGATSIDVVDVYPWTFDGNEEENSKIGKILIGVGLATSEVRAVTDTHYTADGNSITLSAMTTGGVTATASGATLSGGSSSTRATADIDIGGSPVEGDTITVTINGFEVFYELTPGVYGSGASVENGVAACLAFAINSHPIVRTFIEATVEDFADQSVHLFCKWGSLDLSSELEEAHEADEETIRVMMSFAGKALTHANTTRANILNGSFKYLGSNGQTRYNQFKGAFHDPLRDFAEQSLVINDYDHQKRVNKTVTLEIDLSAVDNYNQASRLLNGANAKFGDGVDFFGWGSNGLALQLEEGDRVCVSYPAAPVWQPNRDYALGDLVVAVPLNGHRYVVTTAGTSGLTQPDFPTGTGATVSSGSVVFTEAGSDDKNAFRNIPVTIEQLQLNSNYEVSFTARIYSTSFFNDEVIQTDVPLVSGLPNFGAGPPDIAFNTTDFPPDGLIQSTDGTAGITTIRGGAIFGDSVYTQYGKVSVKRPGDTDFEQITILHPDSNLEATFEFIASVAGLYTVQLEVCGQWGCNTTKPTADIVVGLGAIQGDFILPRIVISGSGGSGGGSGGFVIP